ncbi:MAG: tetratricopeptide repeat protein, partial [Nitrospira sp.]|nr:tetratricopeptide repeat protein [Nitrospira sp.]
MATVKVWERPEQGIKAMAVDGHEIGFSAGLMLEKQKLLAHLPLLFKPGLEAESALLIGLGSGITLGSVKLWESLKTLDAVEIVPSVVEGAKYFKEENKDALSDSGKVRIFVEDGVNYLLATPQTYDFISDDGKLNPTYVGNAIFFTREYYQLCLNRLNPEGIFAQWVPLYVPPRLYQMILRTFLQVFSYAGVWVFDSGHVILIGAKAELVPDYETLKNRLAQTQIRQDLATINLDDPFVLLGAYVANEQALRRALPAGLLNTRDRPHIEFRATLEFMTGFTNQRKAENLSFFLQLGGPPLASVHDEKIRDRLRSAIISHRQVLAGLLEVFRADLMAGGYPQFYQASLLYPENPRLPALWERIIREEETARAAVATNPTHAEVHFHLGQIYFYTNQLEQAKEELEKASKLNPDLQNLDTYLGGTYFLL